MYIEGAITSKSRNIALTDPKDSLTVDVSMETTIFLNTRWVIADVNWKHCSM